MKKDNLGNESTGAERQKVPVIRLKLKVQKEEVGTGSIVSNDNAIVTSVTSVTGVTGVTDVTCPVNSESLTHVPAQVPVQQEQVPVSPTFSTSPTHNFHGTFKYRPFKLFPLLPPASRYRVLVPAKYTRHLHSHPAIRRNYLWNTDDSRGIYTDDSDLVCVVIREGLYVPDIKGKGVDLLIEVEVTEKKIIVSQGIQGDIAVKATEESDTNKSGTVNSPNSDTVHSPNSDTVHSPNTHSLTVTPRFCANHDGNHIRVLSCTVNPSTVHLKRWRKLNKKYNDGDSIKTPVFKPNGGGGAKVK